MTAVREFCARLAQDLVDSAPSLVGVYVHGSAVLGDWHDGVSDIDVLVVTRDRSVAVAEKLVAVLNDGRDCPGVGLEVSVVAAADAAAPASPWPYVVHVTTAPFDRKIVWGDRIEGDVDLILHYLVARASARAEYGPSPVDVFGVIADDIVMHQMANELRWSLEHASESYAVLNACRALRYSQDRIVCSKTDAGRWALARGMEPALIRRAIAARSKGRGEPVKADAASFVSAVATNIARS